MSEFFERKVRNHVVSIELDRPPVNALSDAVIVELGHLIETLDSDQEARVAVISGGPKCFSAGVDIRELRAAPASDAVLRNSRYQKIYSSLDRCRIPVIAAVNGYALGGGCELAMACDIRVAATDAYFGLPEITLGGLPGIGGMQRLQRLVGQGKAKQLVLTGDRIEAPEAWRVGLVDQLATEGDAIADAIALGERIASRPPLSVQAGKWALNTGREVALEAAQCVDLAACGRVAATEDRAESLRAFLEKRLPKLVGR